MTQRRNSVFVGNIPYDASEEQLTEIFSEVGPVVSFRLLFDRATGKPRGYGFCEYRDVETARSAKRNLNGREMNGRQLRVDEADKSNSGGSMPPNNPHQPMGAPPTMMHQAPVPQQAPPQNPATAALTQSLSGIKSALEGMPKEKLYQVMWEFKQIVTQNPHQARQILSNNPKLSWILLQGQLMLGMISPSVMAQLVPGMQQPAPPQQQQQQQPQPVPQQPMYAAPPQQPAPPPQQPPMYAGGTAAPQQQPAPPPQQPPMYSTTNAAPAQSQDQMLQQQQLLQQVLSLTPQQIAQLPPHQREQVKQLQEQARAARAQQQR